MSGKYALCIGINNYPGTENDLAGCVNDANDWAGALVRHGFQVAKMLDERATGGAIRKTIKTAVSQAKTGDLLVLTYSGHGSFVPDVDGDEPDGTDECICPYDIMTKGPITDDEFFSLFSARGEGVRIVMISDSCHSGTVSRFAPITTPPTMKSANAPQRKVRFLPPDVFLSSRAVGKLGVKRAMRPSSPPGRYAALLLAACQDTEYSYDAWFNGRPNGAFSFVALQKLRSLPANATYRQWFDAIRSTLPSPQYPQSPNLFGARDMKIWRVLA